MYAPVIQKARPKRRYTFTNYEAVFFDQIVAEGSISYEFMIVVFEKGKQAPFLLVTSEKNDPVAAAAVMKELGLDDITTEREGASHFLCLFDERGHHNFGDSNDWGNADKFEKAALRILQDRLGETPADA